LKAGVELPAWRNVRTFGAPDPRLSLRVRPSAYALLADADGRIALARAPDGVYLPGGGIEAGETPKQAVAREALEECGYRLRVGRCVQRAVQYALADTGQACLQKRCRFYEAAIEGEDMGQVHPGHETLWVAPADVHRYLSHESQVWVVRAWCGPG